MDMQRLLKAAIQFNASDLHVQVGSPPTVRVDGTMVAINAPPVTAENLRELVVQVANESQLQRLESDRSCDFSYSIPDVARFRINVFHEQDNLCIAARSIPLKIKSFAELGLPAVLQDIAEE
jgi:twitching motility protein PilT